MKPLAARHVLLHVLRLLVVLQIVSREVRLATSETKLVRNDVKKYSEGLQVAKVVLDFVMHAFDMSRQRSSLIELLAAVARVDRTRMLVGFMGTKRLLGHWKVEIGKLRNLNLKAMKLNSPDTKVHRSQFHLRLSLGSIWLT